ncbi:MAG: hypothetical protein IJ683_07085 [Butyrivibrio sp.]|nr:hypothetical protein [Butyrivibrio sp.]MBR1642067.1 hypothetical protein [Butyrivibrio sp.]
MSYIKRLFASGLLDELSEKGLFAKAWITDFTCEGKLVTEQEIIEPIEQNGFSQWSFLMQRDVALLVLQVNEICNRYGYQLMDCHQGNMLFSGQTPIYIDLGSIAKWTGGWRATSEFITTYYYVLLLWSRGYKKLSSAILESRLRMDRKSVELIVKGVLGEEYIIEKFDPDYMRNWLNNVENADDQFWSHYQDDMWKQDVASNKRFQREIDWINSKNISSMVELGANQGYFSYNVAINTNVKSIVATDYDSSAVDTMYSKFKTMEKGEMITPLCVDFTGVVSPIRCDLVVANALVHHLIFTNHMRIGAIVDKLAAWTNKYLIVEFMPRGMSFGSRVPLWYTLDWFLNELSKRFEIEKTEEATYGRIQIYAIKKEQNV